jgi:DNA-nicking Smr family endonuclease
MAKKPGKGKGGDDDDAVFRAAMADTTPLPGRDTRRQPVEPAPPRPGKTPKPPDRTPPPAQQTAPSNPPLTAGTAADLDRRTMDRLRKGRMRPEALIDLHGRTASAAHTALNAFIASSHEAGKRCVLVITGKGSMKKGGGIIRREFPAWLNAPGNRACVLGFAQAQPADGGGGAYYVLLKRKRPTK